MSNLSYCRFENTVADLEDCADALDEGDFDNLTSAERRAKDKLIRLCADIARRHGPEEYGRGATPVAMEFGAGQKP